jgi:hypothetical protein
MVLGKKLLLNKLQMRGTGQTTSVQRCLILRDSCACGFPQQWTQGLVQI